MLGLIDLEFQLRRQYLTDFGSSCRSFDNVLGCNHGIRSGCADSMVRIVDRLPNLDSFGFASKYCLRSDPARILTGVLLGF